jgi:hypothetical protein
MVTAKPCTYDGIHFRSKLEAHWYSFFTALELRPIFEPDCFVVSIHDVELSEQLGEVYWEDVNYLPDFLLQETNTYVEIKPLKDEYDCKEAISIQKAYSLGYEHPTIVILGSPFEYYAAQIKEKHIGREHDGDYPPELNEDGLDCPFGSTARFTYKAIQSVEPWAVIRYNGFGQPLFTDPRRNIYAFDLTAMCQAIPTCGWERAVAAQTWNRLQWRPK